MPAKDIADRLELVARRHVEERLPPDPSGELAAMGCADLLITYGNWRGRFIPQRVRKAHLSRELEAELPGSQYESAVRAVRAECETGSDLTPRLSKDVLVAHLPEKKRKKAGRDGTRHLDTQLAHDGLHHLHLGQGSGAFVPRGGPLLFVAVREADAYFVGVYPHGAWGRRELLERMVRNWPDAELLHGFAGLIPERDLTDEERWKLMEAGVTTLIGIDGKVYMGPGQTGAGTPIDVTRRVNAFMHELRWLREHGLRARLQQANADPGVYWNPVVRDEQIGLESSHGLLPLGRLA